MNRILHLWQRQWSRLNHRRSEDRSGQSKQSVSVTQCTTHEGCILAFHKEWASNTCSLTTSSQLWQSLLAIDRVCVCKLERHSAIAEVKSRTMKEASDRRGMGDLERKIVDPLIR